MSFSTGAFALKPCPCSSTEIGECRRNAGREAQLRGTARNEICCDALEVGKADAGKGVGEAVAIVAI